MAAGTLLSAVIGALAKDTESWREVLRLLDSTSVLCGTTRETVKRSEIGRTRRILILRLTFSPLLGLSPVFDQHPGLRLGHHRAAQNRQCL